MKHKGNPKGGVWKVVHVQRVYHNSVLQCEYVFSGEQVACITYWPNGVPSRTDTITLDAWIAGLREIASDIADTPENGA